MDEFQSKFVDALCRSEVANGIEGVIEPLLDQHREKFMHLIHRMINPLTSLTKQKEKGFTLNEATSVHQVAEGQGQRLSFKEVRSIWIYKSDEAKSFTSNVNWQPLIFRLKLLIARLFGFWYRNIVLTGMVSIDSSNPFQLVSIWKRRLDLWLRRA